MNKIIMAATAIIIVATLGTSSHAFAWGYGWHHQWGGPYYNGYAGGYQNGYVGGPGCDCQNNYQPQYQQDQPPVSSNQGSDVNVVNSPGAYVSVNQNQQTTLGQVVHSLCDITGVNCGGNGYNP